MDVTSSHSVNNHSSSAKSNYHPTTPHLNSPAETSNSTSLHKPHHPKTNSKRNHNLKIFQLSINGIRNKIAELQQLLVQETIDVAVIQETGLHPSYKTTKIPN